MATEARKVPSSPTVGFGLGRPSGQQVHAASVPGSEARPRTR